MLKFGHLDCLEWTQNKMKNKGEIGKIEKRIGDKVWLEESQLMFSEEMAIGQVLLQDYRKVKLQAYSILYE